MKINQKKAFIDQIMLGLFLIVTVFVFVATVADNQKAKNEVLEIKKILQTVALASAKCYIDDSCSKNPLKCNPMLDTQEECSQNIALGIIDQTTLGTKVKGSLEFTWETSEEPNYVKVKIQNYTVDYFWYRLLDLNSTTIDVLEAKAKINIKDSDIAINGCGKTFEIGQTYDFLYQSSNLFNRDHNFAFYNKNAIDSSNNFSEDIESFMNLNNFLGKKINLDILDCDGSIREIIPVHINNEYCAKRCCSSSLMGMISFNGCSSFMNMMCSIMQIFNNFTQDMFDSIAWTSATNDSCIDTNLFRINFTILDSNEKKVILEY